MDRHPRDAGEGLDGLSRRLRIVERWMASGRGFQRLSINVSALGLTGTVVLLLRDHIVHATGELTGTATGTGVLFTISDPDFRPHTPVARWVGGSGLSTTSSRKVTISATGEVRVAENNGGAGLEFNSLTWVTPS